MEVKLKQPKLPLHQTTKNVDVFSSETTNEDYIKIENEENNNYLLYIDEHDE